MDKPIDINTGRDKVLNKKMDEVLYKLSNLHKLPGLTRQQAEDVIDIMLVTIKQNALDYFDSMYDEDEPNVAAFNLLEYLKDLEDLSSGHVEVTRE